MPSTDTNGNGPVTWKWLVGILFTLVLLTAGGFLADTRANIAKVENKVECVEKEKLDKEQYYRDLQEMKSAITRIDNFVRNRR